MECPKCKGMMMLERFSDFFSSFSTPGNASTVVPSSTGPFRRTVGRASPLATLNRLRPADPADPRSVLCEMWWCDDPSGHLPQPA